VVSEGFDFADTKVHFFKSLLKIEVKDYFETKMKLEEG